jgi:hypothetical protein
MQKKLTLLMVLLLTLSYTFAAFRLDVEAGAAFSGYNDARIPGDGEATKFSLSEDLKSDPAFASRFNFHYWLNEQHRLSFLIAPLKITPEGRFDSDVLFQGETFAAGEDISAVYRFDSYRLQYRYYFRNQDLLIKGIGASLKLRDAEISLESAELRAKKTNTGFVPLLNLELAYDFSPEFSLIVDAEGLWSPYGRAADVLTSINYVLDDRFTIFAGYRLLEGGSDGDEVYTFALINYAVLGLRIDF